MNTLQAGWATFRHVRDLISQGTDISPKSGVWVTHVTRAAFIASMLLSTVLFGVTVLIWWVSGRPGEVWVMTALAGCALAISFVSQAVARAIDTNPGQPPSNKVFAAWAALTALLGLPLAHLALYLASRVQVLGAVPILAKYFPEVLIVLLVATSYWRLVIVRLWFERLANEKLRRQAAEQGRALAETRLNLLEAQVEPHFLFNTLASVQHLVRKDAAQADVLLVQLISYLRQAIPDLRGSASTLGRELELVRTYLGIVRLRMGGRLAVDVQCPPGLEDAAFPSLVVHALVENAIKHGVEMQPGPVRIAVHARRERHGAQDCIAVSVEDDGAGLGAAGQGTALATIRDRLVLTYDGLARLDVEAAAGGGVRATVSIPAR